MIHSGKTTIEYNYILSGTSNDSKKHSIRLSLVGNGDYEISVDGVTFVITPEVWDKLNDASKMIRQIQ